MGDECGNLMFSTSLVEIYKNWVSKITEVAIERSVRRKIGAHEFREISAELSQNIRLHMKVDIGTPSWGGGSECNHSNYKGYYHPIKLVPSKMERTTEYFSYKKNRGSIRVLVSKIHSIKGPS